MRIIKSRNLITYMTSINNEIQAVVLLQTEHDKNEVYQSVNMDVPTVEYLTLCYVSCCIVYDDDHILKLMLMALGFREI